MQKNQEREMLQAFKRAADKIVADLEADGVAEQVSFSTLGEGAPPLLMTPGAFTREQLIILISGIPESTGVWSYTLLQQGKKRETSMEPYFKMARSLGWGLVALNPHGGGTEGTRGDYGKQLDGLVHNLHEINIVKDLYIICFSAGGSVLVEYLNQRDGLAESVRRMVLIDTTPPPLTKGNLKAEVRALLDRTTLYGLLEANGKLSMWATATQTVLGLRAVPVEAPLHGALPNLLVERVRDFLSNKEGL